MKKVFLLSMVITMCFLGGCGSRTKSTSSRDINATKKTEAEKDTASEKEPIEKDTIEKEVDNTEKEAPASSNATMTAEEFDGILAKLPLSVLETKYTIQDEEYKALYPDMLQAIIQNNTDKDIKSAIIAFAAWDENGLPVKIRGFFSYTEGEYISKVDYSDINLEAGGTFGDDSGYELREDQNIESYKSIVVSYESFDGEEWTNPYFDEFCTLYEGKKLADAVSVEVNLEETTVSSGGSTKVEEKGDSPAIGELEELLAKEPVFVTSTEYAVQDYEYKTLYPDMLLALIQNNSADDIKDAVVAFVAWDKNGLPVKIKGYMSYTEGSYIQEVAYDDINLTAGGSFGEDYGLQLDEDEGIETFKAMVVSYETFDGTTWENPHYDAFCSLYEGKKLK
jgi:hypothetical protein